MQMHELDDHSLLREFTEQNSETAFAALVARHVDKVYSTALRHTRNAHAAEEITQAVFVILAKKSGRLGAKVILAGWLYETARLTAVTYIRSEIRRARREQEAHMNTALNENADDAWPHIAPLLDDAMSKLSEADRHAIVLRYFDGKSLCEVGAALGASEDAAKKRVTRAVEKLRGWFTKRGVTLTATVLTAAISANSVQAAPFGLAKTISVVAMAKGAAAGGSTLALVKGALKVMAWTKMKTAVVVGVGILLATGTTTVALKKIQENRFHSWQMMKDFRPPWSFDTLPQQVEIFPTKFQQQKHSGPQAVENTSDGRFVGICQPIKSVIEYTFHIQYPIRVIYAAELPMGKYDFIGSFKHGSSAAMQQKLIDKFGLAGRIESVVTNVLVLKIKNPDDLKLKVSTARVGSNQFGNGGISCTNGTMNELARYLEDYLKIPVLNQTGLTKGFDFKISWDAYPGSSGIKQALLEQLGLELISSNAPVEMLVVEKVK